jgi:archaellum biogenesis protein FlaJ (TadC family)
MDFAPMKTIVAVTMAIAVAVISTATPPNHVQMKKRPTKLMRKEHVAVSVSVILLIVYIHESRPTHFVFFVQAEVLATVFVMMAFAAASLGSVARASSIVQD